MAFNDFDVIVYKVLAYLYECIRAGVTPNIAKARELTKKLSLETFSKYEYLTTSQGEMVLCEE